VVENVAIRETIANVF